LENQIFQQQQQQNKNKQTALPQSAKITYV